MKLIDWIKSLFCMDDENAILDDDDYDTGTLMAYIKPGEKLDTIY